MKTIKDELDEIITELDDIIRHITYIKDGMDGKFIGIGSESCVSALGEAIKKHRIGKEALVKAASCESASKDYNDAMGY